MILNSKFSNFIFTFPRGWLYPDIDEKYAIFFKRLPIPYRNTLDYINFTVQSISWPGIDTQTPSQTVTQKRDDVRNGVASGKHSTRDFKSGFDMALSAMKEFNVIFRTTEGFLNYWIMHDQFEQYLSYGANNEAFLSDVQLQILDHYGYLIMTRVYHNIVMTGISELELSYSSNIPEYRTFTCNFKHNGFTLKKELQ